jgi:hypothetical protein
MSEGLQNFQITTWYKAAIAVGTLALLAALAGSKDNAAIVATGCIIIGIGEWINHPKRIRFEWHAKITDVSRLPNVAGLLVEMCGAIIVIYGVYRMMRG